MTTPTIPQPPTPDDFRRIRTLTILAGMALQAGDVIAAERILADAQKRAFTAAVMTARTNDQIEYVVGWSDRKGRDGKTLITSTSPYLAAVMWLNSPEAADLPDDSIAACDTPDKMDNIANHDDPECPAINLYKEYGMWTEIDIYC